MLTEKAKSVLNDIADVLEKHGAYLDLMGSLDISFTGEPAANDIKVYATQDGDAWMNISPKLIREMAK